MYTFVYIRTRLFRDRTVTKNYSISRGNTADKAIPLRCHNMYIENVLYMQLPPRKCFYTK